MAKQARGGLGLWDRLVLLVAWVVTCGLVYLLGIYVGKGMQERLLGHEERVVRLPVTGVPPREGEKPKADGELTFYDTLVRDTERQKQTRGPEPAARPAAPAPVPVATPPARPATPPATTAAPVVARSTPPTPAVPAARPVPPAAPAAPPRREPVVAVAPPPPSVPAPEPGAAPGAAPAARAGGGNWTVLANPTRSQDEAEDLARQLRTRGYAASVVRVAREGGTWYRVAVGRFASAEQATEMMQRLREREGVAHVFVAAE